MRLLPDRAIIHAAWWCAASSRPSKVPNICCERQHAAAREISCDSGRISDHNFRGRKNLRSKSHGNAPKFMPPGGAQLLDDPQRSPTSVPSVSMLRQVRFRAIRGGFRTENFAAAKFCVRNRMRSRRNPCRLVVRSFLTILKVSQHQLRASACCGRGDYVRFRSDSGPKFSRSQNCAFEIA